MRGKVIVDLVLTKGHRITPAYAGKSRARKAAVAVRRDHPRVCEEKLAARRCSASILGSLPHMRGKGNFHVVTHTKVGITPAYAGKSQFNWMKKAEGGGSPPRMRGKACIMQIISALIGITPAYAGKSRKVFQIDCRTGDHPRVCGEKPQGIPD